MGEGKPPPAKLHVYNSRLVMYSSASKGAEDLKKRDPDSSGETKWTCCTGYRRGETEEGLAASREMTANRVTRRRSERLQSFTGHH